MSPISLSGGGLRGSIFWLSVSPANERRKNHVVVGVSGKEKFVHQ